MRLKPFRKSKIEKINTKIILVLGIIVCGLLSVIAYYSYSIFKTNKTHNFIQGEVGTFSSGDFQLAVYVDGTKTNEFPTRESGYLFEKIECNNSGAARWDLENWKLNVLDIDGPTSCSVYFAESASLKEILLMHNTIKSGNPNFGSISNDGDTGMYSMEDDEGTSYYFRGTKELLNNNVIFAGHQWKIIRINGDGSIRMIYNGTCPLDSCAINDTGATTQIGTSKFNPAQDDAIYVGYTYNTNTNSTIKGVIESWYQNTLSSYDTYIADTIYCNDRTSTGSGTIYFGAYTRLITNKNPNLKCPNAADKYTKSATIGNGLLAQKVGLITADEIAIAGGVWNTDNNTYYLYSAQYYWTLSPYASDWSGAGGFHVSSTGHLYTDYVASACGARPVIALHSTAQISGGNGSTANPYIIKY